MTHIWLRDEARSTERRAPLTPEGAATLIARGARVTVERSGKRIFSDEEYRAAGCELADAGGWPEAPSETLVLGVKELPEAPQKLYGRFAHFAHLYKEQRGWQDELARFQPGALLYDLEYLTAENGRRVAAFGYWAGWLGAAIGLWGWLCDGKDGPFGGVTSADDREAFLAPVRAAMQDREKPRVLVVGALGRSGSGACDLFTALGIEPTRWDMAETADLDREALLGHDILVSCVLMTGPGLVLVRPEDVGQGRLSMISDVACDPLSDFNPLPVYDAPTSWDQPFNGLGETGWLTAIDNLPSLLPKEASEDFAAQLLPTLAAYPDGTAWKNAKAAFGEARERT